MLQQAAATTDGRLIYSLLYSFNGPTEHLCKSFRGLELKPRKHVYSTAITWWMRRCNICCGFVVPQKYLSCFCLSLKLLYLKLSWDLNIYKVWVTKNVLVSTPGDQCWVILIFLSQGQVISGTISPPLLCTATQYFPFQVIFDQGFCVTHKYEVQCKLYYLFCWSTAIL